MRAYFFGNMYLSSIQQGIQAAHVVAEMFLKYDVRTSSMMGERDILYEWARDHKTMILLNAGYASEIQSLCTFFDDGLNPYPYAYFREDESTLNESLTSIGIIVPEKIYEGAREIREFAGHYGALHSPTAQWVKQMSDFEIDLATRLNNYGLAR